MEAYFVLFPIADFRFPISDFVLNRWSVVWGGGGGGGGGGRRGDRLYYSLGRVETGGGI